MPVFILLLIIITLLLFKSGSLELNPGPNTHRLKTLSICHVNIRGLNSSKLRAIQTSLSKGLDIITISETFLSQSTKSTELKLPGFHDIMRRDRPTFGGGVAVYIRDSIPYKRITQSEHISLEQIWFQISTKEGKVMICNVYRPPTYATFWEQFSSNLEKVKSENPNMKYFLILGDLNADPNDINGKYLNDICEAQNLQCLVKEPTRITSVSQTCIDQIITNMPNFVKNVTVSPPVSTNDHCTVTAEFNFKLPKEEPYTRHIWQYTKGDNIKFQNALRNANWDECFKTGDVNTSCEMWTESFLNIARTHIPNKVVLVRPNDSPWYSNKLRLLKRKVDRLYKKAKRYKTVLSWDRYKRLRNTYQSSLDTAEATYKKDLSGSLSSTQNTKHWWSTVKSLLGHGGQDNYPAMTHPDNGTFICDNKGKASLFNNFFLSHNKIDDSNAKLPNNYPECLASLHEIVATEEEVLDQLKALDVNKATGPDEISPRLLNMAGETIVPSLTKLINLSLTSCKVPDSWKKANVTPIHKKGDKDKVNNYRPISLLPTVSKILEKIVFKHVYNFLHTNNLLSVHQSGFRPGDSTLNQLALIYHEICDALDKKKDVRIVFCDVSKAFDKVWHKGLLFKLFMIGIRGRLYEWFKDYLINRKQRVVIRGQSSEWGIIEAGVPQGSNLGPLLFLIFIDDLSKAVNCHIKLFADDTCLYVTVDDPNEASESLNTNLNNVRKWANQWLVKFNAEKTKAMTVSNKHLVHPPIQFDGVTLENVNTHKHLGLIFSKDLSWSYHIDSIIKDASKMLDVMRMLKYDVDRKSLETIYFTYIRPKLEYACQIWDDCTTRESNKLENLQLYAARIITGAKKGTSHELLYNDVSWSTLADRRTHVKLKYMHKIVHGNVPIFLSSVLPQVVGNVVPYRLRNRHNLTQFQCRTEKFRKSFFPDGIRLWNNLDEEIKSIDNIYEFNSKLPDMNKRSRKLYNYGVRQYNIIHAQLRLQCSNLKAHLYSLHVIDDPTCCCTIANEDNFHFFFQCPMYLVQRQNLVDSIRQITRLNRLTVNVLLYGDDTFDDNVNQDIFAAVHMYIKDSGRFNM